MLARTNDQCCVLYVFSEWCKFDLWSHTWSTCGSMSGGDEAYGTYSSVELNGFVYGVPDWGGAVRKINSATGHVSTFTNHDGKNELKGQCC